MANDQHGPSRASAGVVRQPGRARRGVGALEPYFPTRPFPSVLAQLTAPAPTPPPPTPWVTYPDLYTAQRLYRNGASWLQVNDNAGPSDHRPVVRPAGPQLGLHAVDVNLAFGNLVALVRHEGAAYARRTAGP